MSSANMRRSKSAQATYGGLLAECRIWEGYVGAGPYFTAGAFSIADIVVLPFFGTIIDGLGLPKADYPNLHAWYERCKARPSVAKQPRFEAFAGEKKNEEQHVLAAPAAWVGPPRRHNLCLAKTPLARSRAQH